MSVELIMACSISLIFICLFFDFFLFDFSIKLLSNIFLFTMRSCLLALFKITFSFFKYALTEEILMPLKRVFALNFTKFSLLRSFK